MKIFKALYRVLAFAAGFLLISVVAGKDVDRTDTIFKSIGATCVVYLLGWIENRGGNTGTRA